MNKVIFALLVSVITIKAVFLPDTCETDNGKRYQNCEINKEK